MDNMFSNWFDAPKAHYIDFIILAFGGLLFLVVVGAILFQNHSWANLVEQLCELLPLAGICGTVNGIFRTFNTSGHDPKQLFKSFAPALTSTFVALVILAILLALVALFRTIHGNNEKGQES